MMGNLPEEPVENKARWVRVSVETFDHEILDVGRYDRRSAWLWLITNAAWKERRVNHKGHPITLKRGQLLGARSFLAEKFGWGEQELRTFLKALVTNGMVEINQSNGHFANVITICNYDKYQSSENSKSQCHNQCPTSAQPVPNQISTKDTSYTNNPPQTPPSNVKPIGDWRSAFGADDHGVEFTGGKLTLVNGTRAFWLGEFDGDAKALDLALIEAAGSIQRNSPAGLKQQVERKLANIARDRHDRSQNYTKAVIANAKAKATAKPVKLSRW